ncbi:uncharacterized protein LOC131294187 [Anopheles ziemanni]|uniref:uncharacterized protein LOC131263445 n=1 Tax=Anopheles coustani TaxID=139045 RepID=UPI00265AA47A|nr:uncharacterized protein LOC131263445 [Anopheles coustani]XP_058178215.1 uncharacterized protein LOC131294187 [Anopheles ziemanni]
MVDTRKQNASGPKPRKTLESVRQPSHDDDKTMIESSSVGSVERQHDNSTHNIEVSGCNSTLPYTDGDDLIDTDGSISEDCTDDDEPLVKEATPVSYQPEALPVPANRSKKTPSKQIATPKTPHQKQPPQPYTEASVNNEVEFPVACILIAILLIGCGYVVHYKVQKYFTKPPVIHEKCEEFYNLEKSYTNVKNTLWDALNVSFSRANNQKERREPGTFLFLHDGSIEMVDRFIETISKITAHCFGGTKPILLDRKYFQRADIQRDFGEFIPLQKAALQEQGIMVVRNLENIPPMAVQAFHSICDPEEPLVDRAVIYFTMDTSKVGGQMTHDSGRSATAEAEMLLYQMWKNVLKPEVLGPLVTRLTENVYRIV